MPSGKVHRLDSRLRGYDNRVNQMLDLPYAWLGRSHRVLFHDEASAAAIGYAIDGPRGAAGALGHLALDRLCSGNRTLKALLELAAVSKTAQSGITVIIRPEDFRKDRVVRFRSRPSNA